ncbi:MAG TPA: ABC transporter permease [Candidatus Sulfotelmatobacter sp.]|nr:ABC transporter permease [Candidatus Sulfotelmatobacter sp.]
MRTYVLRRFLQLIPLLLGISAVTFLLLHLAPGSFLDQAAEDPTVTAARLEALRHQFGLDRPAWIQYLLYLGNLLRGNLGESFVRHQPVALVLRQALGNTLLLTGAAALVTWALALPLGTLAAARQHRWPDRLATVSAVLGLSIPEVLSGLLLLLLAARTGWFPVGGMRSLDWDRLSFMGKLGDLARHLALPALVVGLTPLASRMRQMRASLLDVLRLDYIATARAKGLGEFAVVTRHALRNALNPMITLFGYTLGALVSGSFVVEIIFSWPGLGRITLEALLAHDQWLVMGAVLMSSLVLVSGNLVADLLLVAADPRIRHE